jgi:SAM-dependent methyltransferase
LEQLLRLKALQRNWERWGQIDPLYAISTAPQYRGNQWDEQDFFRTGRESINQLCAELRTSAPGLRWHRALDFGCGVGRLTLALAEQFDHATGVDIAPAMLSRARSYAEGSTKVSFVLNTTADLAQFATGSFDLVLSDITLLHIEPTQSKAYIAEFVRVCRPGGVIRFHLPAPTRRQQIRSRIPRPIVSLGYAVKSLPRPIMEVYGVDEAEVTALLEAAGAEVCDVRSSPAATYRSASNYYTALKP